jgi:hypothetical protein
MALKRFPRERPKSAGHLPENSLVRVERRVKDIARGGKLRSTMPGAQPSASNGRCLGAAAFDVLTRVGVLAHLALSR